MSSRVAWDRITTPRPGWLLIQSSGTCNTPDHSAVTFTYWLELNETEIDSSEQKVLVEPAGSQKLIPCPTMSVMEVDRGTHKFDLVVNATSTDASIRNAGISALYVPYDGEGLVP